MIDADSNILDCFIWILITEILGSQNNTYNQYVINQFVCDDVCINPVLEHRRTSPEAYEVPIQANRVYL